MIDAFVIKLRWRIFSYEGQNVFRKFWMDLFSFVINRNEENCRHLDFEQTFETMIEQFKDTQETQPKQQSQ